MLFYTDVFTFNYLNNNYNICFIYDTALYIACIVCCLLLSLSLSLPLSPPHFRPLSSLFINPPISSSVWVMAKHIKTNKYIEITEQVVQHR